MIMVYATIETHSEDGVEIEQRGPWAAYADTVFEAEDDLRERLEEHGYIVSEVWAVEA